MLAGFFRESAIVKRESICKICLGKKVILKIIA